MSYKINIFYRFLINTLSLKSKVHHYYQLIAVMLIFSSCDKYLEEKANKSLIVPTTIEDLQGLLDNNDNLNQRTTPGFGETSSDDYFLTLASYNSMSVEDQNSYTWRLQNYMYKNDWAFAYTPVYYANLCLEQIEKVEKNVQNELKWNNVKGSALFFRAYYFLNLVWEYGKAYDESTSSDDLGIVLRMGSDFNVPSKRATVKESYEQIIEDLNEATLLLPEKAVHVMRPSKTAAYALLARTYLSMRMYDSAYHYANLCLQLKNDLLDYNLSSEVNQTALSPFQPYNKEIIFFTSQTGNYPPKSPARANIDTVLFNSYESNDNRSVVFFRNLNGYKGFKGSFASPYLFLFSGLATDEIYLIRSEANARAGRVNEAMNDLNTLLAKRYKASFVPRTASTQQQAVSMILLERRKELLMRGLRWIDIKRLNKEGANITLKRVVGSEVFSLQPNDDRFALPLPSDITDLTGIPQN
jgi:hypothetical protein